MSKTTLLIVNNDAFLSESVRPFLNKEKIAYDEISFSEFEGQCLQKEGWDEEYSGYILHISNEEEAQFLASHVQVSSSFIVISNCVAKLKEGILVRKPFRVSDLLRYILDISKSKKPLSTFSFGAFVFDGQSKVLHCTETDADTFLTEKEAKLLWLLHQAAGDAVAKERCLESVWGYSKGISTRTLESHIYRLRQKVEKNPATPVWLLTTPKGYCLVR
ncbi:MAG: hypothetical protein HOI80_03210 [Alphaproteobacteria bacterium]|nr:hypothetical protein [Alphaproteobacteria bacterium]MBT5654493.1 hypothetical protein [Alphaproteobacteria bacterium]